MNVDITEILHHVNVILNKLVYLIVKLIILFNVYEYIHLHFYLNFIFLKLYYVVLSAIIPSYVTLYWCCIYDSRYLILFVHQQSSQQRIKQYCDQRLQFCKTGTRIILGTEESRIILGTARSRNKLRIILRNYS